MGLPTTNVDIPILENVDVSILENMHSPIPENVDVPISQTQFQRVDLDSLDYDPGTHKQIWEYRANQRDEIWVFVLVDSLLILYECVFEFFFSLISVPLPPPSLKSWVRPWLCVLEEYVSRKEEAVEWWMTALLRISHLGNVI